MTRATKWFAILGVAVLAACKSQGETPLDPTIIELGYDPLRPPTRLPVPGTLVEWSQTRPGALNMLCSAGKVIGNAKPMVSATAVQQKLETSGAKYSLDATVAQLATVEASLAYVQSMAVTFSNVRVLEIKDEDVDPAALSARCKGIIRMRQGKGENVTVIRSAIVGDANYAIRFEKDASVQVRESALKALKAAFSAELKKKSETEVTGTGLVWGVRDDSLLVSLVLGGLGGQERPKDRPILPQVAFTVTVAADGE